jgi:DnaK suppressor protein
MAKKTTAKKAVKKKAAKKQTKQAPKKKTATKKKSAASAPKKTAKSKSSTKLTPRQKIIQQIKQNLMNQREALLREAEETLSSLPSELNFPDMGDQATAETDRNFILRLRDRERMLLKKIDETIERIDNNKDFGKCEECGLEIGTKRLEARPVTTYCIECKTRQEEEERIAEGG